MKTLVCGGQDYGLSMEEKRTFDFALDKFHHDKGPITQIIQGQARGADWLARLWAVRNEIPCKSYPANWGKHGASAGSIRNEQMLDEGKPDVVIAFPGGRGTAHMKRIAEEQGIEVIIPVKE